MFAFKGILFNNALINDNRLRYEMNALSRVLVNDHSLTNLTD